MKRAVALGLAMLAGAAISAAAVNGLHAGAKARGAYETPIWKTITLGTYPNANVLREDLDSAHCSIEKVTRITFAGHASPTAPIYNDESRMPFCLLEALANEIIGRPAFALSRTKTNVDLVVLSSPNSVSGGKEHPLMLFIREPNHWVLRFALPRSDRNCVCSILTSRRARSFTSPCNQSQNMTVILSTSLSKMTSRY